MKKFFFFMLSALMLSAVSCNDAFDDSLLWEKINNHENRIAALEELCKQMNTNITSLQKIVNALQNNDYVTNVAPITKDGETIGYTITFSKSDPITIYLGKDGIDGTNGKDGKDGHTPIIGVKQDADNLYYWTIDGEWLLDNNGNKIKAQSIDGEDGKNGIDGVTPRLKIENDYWWVSYDNGTTWEQLNNAAGDGSNPFLKDVATNDYYVIFTLADGTELAIPRTTQISDNKIYYTTSDNKKIFPSSTDHLFWGAILTSNVYKDGQGVLIFDDTITTIGAKAFAGCTSLTSITIPNGVTKIDSEAFYNCTSLTSVTIGSNVSSIEYRAFGCCYSLSNLTVGNSITTIGTYAFYLCRSLTNLTLPKSVTNIAGYAFGGCSTLSNVTIGDRFNYIDSHAFEECSALTDIYVNISDLATYSTNDNYIHNIPGNKHLLYNNSEITHLTIPNTVKEIKDVVFYNCTSLTSVSIPNSVNIIGTAAFAGCSSLENIMIGDNITRIEDSAFSSCVSITQITIPDNVTYIGNNAFSNCTSLKEVFSKAIAPPTVSYYHAFYNHDPERKFYVPKTSVSAYKSAYGWKEYANDIVGYDFE